MPIFRAENKSQIAALNRYMGKHIKAAVVSSQVSTLGGVDRASIMLTVSLDPRSQWVNGILHNSRYAMFRLDRNGTIENFSHGFRRPVKRMRKSRATSLPDAVSKINKYLRSVS